MKENEKKTRDIEKNKHDFNCERRNDSFVTVACLCLNPFQFQNFSNKNPIVNLKESVKGMFISSVWTTLY